MARPELLPESRSEPLPAFRPAAASGSLRERTAARSWVIGVRLGGDRLIWCRTLATFAVLLALTACGGEGEVAADGSPAGGSAGGQAAPVAPAAAGQPRQPLAPTSGLAALGTPAGFTALPSPQQVVAPLASGRSDPFAPLAPPQAANQSPSLPAGFLFSGVIQSRGLTQAIVQLGGSTTTASASATSGAASPALALAGPTGGTLCVGPQGICPGAGRDDYRLPPGWSVTGIDLRQGVLTLRQGRLPLRLPLATGSSTVSGTGSGTVSGTGSGAGPGQAASSSNHAPSPNPASASPSANAAAGIGR